MVVVKQQPLKWKIVVNLRPLIISGNEKKQCFILRNSNPLIIFKNNVTSMKNKWLANVVKLKF